MPGLTDLDIINLALIELGQPALATLDNTSKPGRIMGALYEPTVKEILFGHPWRCCQKLQVLSVDPDATEPFDFDYACALPADFVRVVKVNDNIDKFRVVGQHIHVDDDAPDLTYTARVPTSEFNPGLVSAIVARLSARACIAITDNATDAKSRADGYLIILADAKFNDSMNGAPEDNPIGTWAQARLSEV